MVPHQPEVKGEGPLPRGAPGPPRRNFSTGAKGDVGEGACAAPFQKEGPRLVGDSQGPLGQGGTGLPNRTAGAFYSDSQLMGVFFFRATH